MCCFYCYFIAVLLQTNSQDGVLPLFACERNCIYCIAHLKHTHVLIVYYIFWVLKVWSCKVNVNTPLSWLLHDTFSTVIDPFLRFLNVSKNIHGLPTKLRSTSKCSPVIKCFLGYVSNIIRLNTNSHCIWSITAPMWCSIPVSVVFFIRIQLWRHKTMWENICCPYSLFLFPRNLFSY